MAVGEHGGRPMSETVNLWHVRFPDGRAYRAAANAIRQHILSGRIPPEVELRRSSSDEWRPLEAFSEFANLKRANGAAPAGTSSWSDFNVDGPAKPPTVASRLDPEQLGLPGIRPLLEEMVAALESTLVFKKVLAALLVGLVVAAVLFAGPVVCSLVVEVPSWAGWAFWAAAGLFELGLMGVLTRMAFSELSRMRPARLRDGYAGLPSLLLKLVVVWGAVFGALAAASWGLRQLPDLLGTHLPQAPWAAPALAGCLFVLSVVECLLWATAAFFGPIAAIFVVEDCSLWQGLATWEQLMSQQRWRLFVSQCLLLAGTAVVLLPLWWLVRLSPAGEQLAVGVAGTLGVAYYSVANVFVYLHLRYERD